MSDAGIWKPLLLPFMIAVGGFGVYVFSGKGPCERLERSLAPIAWVGSFYESSSNDDMGWKSYRLEMFDRLHSALELKEECPQTKELIELELREAQSQKGITDDEKAILLGR